MWRKIVIGFYITLSSAVVIGSSICLLTAEELTAEQIAQREKGSNGNAVGTKGWITKLMECPDVVWKFVKNQFEDAVTDVFNEEILGPMQEFNGYIITEIEKICPPDESGNKKCCMDCNNEEKLKSIIADPETFARYEEAVKKIDPNYLKSKVTNAGVDNVDEIVNGIINEAKNNGTISQYLTKDGKPMSFVEVLRTQCNKKALPCVEERIKTLWGEIITIVESSDCTSIQNEVSVKIQEMKTYGDAGYLTVDVSDKNKEIPKVYIDIMKRSDIFGSVTTVDEFFITLSNWINRVVVEAKCNTGAESTEVVSVGNVVDEFSRWCSENGKDETKSKSLMEFLWSEGVAQLDCGSGDTSIEYMFKPNEQTKVNAKYQVYSIFDEYFTPVFPSLDRIDDDWDDAFNYWYDKQKSLCNY